MNNNETLIISELLIHKCEERLFWDIYILYNQSEGFYEIKKKNDYTNPKI